MILIQVSGGLGNQMFQYALFLKLKSLGKSVKLDLSYYKQINCNRNLELEIFPISLREDEATQNELQMVGREKIKDKLLRYITLGKYSGQFKIYRDKIGIYQPDIFEMDNVYLEGYWQNEQYFNDIEFIIRKTFVFSEDLDYSNRHLLENMRKENSVSIHVRRGDYIDIANQGVYGEICTKGYYKNAIDYINKNVEEPHYYLFSDDIDWVRGNLYQEGMTIVANNRNGASYKDMFLMSQCKHHIIANSTFSWWGAWLSESEKNIVVAPVRWFQNHETTDIICKRWVQVGGI